MASCASLDPTVRVPATALYAIACPPTLTEPSVVESGSTVATGAAGVPATTTFSSFFLSLSFFSCAAAPSVDTAEAVKTPAHTLIQTRFLSIQHTPDHQSLLSMSISVTTQIRREKKSANPADKTLQI